MCGFSHGVMGQSGVKAAEFGSDFHQLLHDLRTPLNHINGFAELLPMAQD